jgi:hypothetical protein
LSRMVNESGEVITKTRYALIIVTSALPKSPICRVKEAVEASFCGVLRTRRPVPLAPGGTLAAVVRWRLHGAVGEADERAERTAVIELLRR